jgi:hypothetical protein
MQPGFDGLLASVRALVGALAVVATLQAHVAATLIVPADFSEMVAESQLVVHGRVAEVRSQMIGSFRTIESVVTITVQETLKGEPGQTVSVRVPGGQVGRYRRVMVGAPVFRPGEEVVVFLSGRPPSIPMPFGLNQGVYRVSRGADGRSLVAAPMLGEGRIVRGDPARRPIEVGSFMQQVRAAVGSSR